MRLMITAATLLLLAGAAPPAGGRAPQELLPAGVDGWTAGVEQRFGADTLHDHIDGAAEIYLAFGVREVVSRRYHGPRGGEIVADLFDMGSSRGAFGAFRFDARTGETAGIGRESELLGSNLAFWKDRYFVSIISFQDSAAARQAALALGRAVAAAIPGDDPPPRIASLLPPGGLVEGQMHYFRGGGILALLSPLGRDNALGLHGETEGLLARYRPATADRSRTSALLLVSYPDESEATAAAAALRRLLSGAPGDAEAGQSADGGWFATRRAGAIVIAVTGGGTKEGSLALLREAAQRLETKAGGAR